MEVHLPGASEGNGDVEEVSSTHVQLLQQIVLIYADSHVLFTLVMICEFYIRRLASVVEGLEKGEVEFIFKLLISLVL